MIRYELAPIHTNVKSFGGKAVVIEDVQHDLLRLYSYETHVCTIEKSEITFIKWFSSTTQKHQKEFVLQKTNRSDLKKSDIESLEHELYLKSL